MLNPTHPNYKLSQLLIYRNLLHDEIIQEMLKFAAPSHAEFNEFKLAAMLIQKAEQLGLSGDLYRNYLLYLLSHDENAFSLLAETGLTTLGTGLSTAVLHDVSILKDCITAGCPPFAANQFIKDFTPSAVSPLPFAELEATLLAAKDCPATEWLSILQQHYAHHGTGAISGYAAFRWSGHQLKGIRCYDSIRLTDLIGYERQKAILIHNTESFLAGKPANNILLTGARGTGKSSSVKALVNEYFSQGLRLLEITKSQLVELPTIMAALRKRGKKFILFLDDLSFEEFETEYKHLKSVIEGGIETKPPNVLIYATSNRRHLIKETFADRSNNAEEIHRFDSVNEKISLSDRFGITLTYLPPNQEEYLAIVRELAAKNGIQRSEKELRESALQWEMLHSGRSGRVAQQFINHLLG